MILDKKLEFCDGQQPTVTNNAVTSSTNVLDFGAHGNDLGKFLRWFLLLESTATSAGDSTLTIKWETSSDNETFAAIYTGSAIALTSLVDDAILINGAVLPDGLKRYNKLTFTVGGADFTASPKITSYVIANDMPAERIST